jgi:lipid-binding SYLF domain-containing protein
LAIEAAAARRIVRKLLLRGVGIFVAGAVFHAGWHVGGLASDYGLVRATSYTWSILIDALSATLRDISNLGKPI